MQQTYFGTLTEVTCAKATCGVTFGLNSTHEKQLRRSHESFHCPNGHSQYFPGQTDEEKLRDELARQKHFTEQAQADAAFVRKQRDRAERRAAAARGQVTKIKKRAHAGVCVECHRTFQNVAAHMATKHAPAKK